MVRDFVDCVEEVKGFPLLVRTDCGRENVVRAERNNDLAGKKHTVMALQLETTDRGLVVVPPPQPSHLVD